MDLPSKVESEMIACINQCVIRVCSVDCVRALRMKRKCLVSMHSANIMAEHPSLLCSTVRRILLRDGSGWGKVGVSISWIRPTTFRPRNYPLWVHGWSWA